MFILVLETLNIDTFGGGFEMGQFWSHLKGIMNLISAAIGIKLLWWIFLINIDGGNFQK